MQAIMLILAAEVSGEWEPYWFAFQFFDDKGFNALGKLLSIVFVTFIFFGIYPLGLFHSNLNHLVVSRWNNIKIIIAINGTIELVWVSGEKCKAGWSSVISENVQILVVVKLQFEKLNRNTNH